MASGSHLKAINAATILIEAIRRIGPTSAWRGNCFGIASQLVAQGIVPGVAVYGHWTGPIAKGSLFDRGTPFVQHGWVLLQDKRIVDPTRWVFEDVSPYIYIGKPDYYDEGGTQFRRSMRSPAPAFTVGKPVRFTKADLPSASWIFVEGLLAHVLPYNDPDYKPRTIGGGQAMWIANHSPEELGGHAAAIYKALTRKGLAGLIPIDNLRRVEREVAAR